MDRFLLLPPADRAQAFGQTGTERGLSPGSVEKDFWVCLMLRELFDLPGAAARAAADMALFEQVAAHRKVYFRRGWMNYDTLKRGTIQMAPQPERIDEWRRDYAAMQGEMFLGVPPAFDEILTRIASFQTDFNTG